MNNETELFRVGGMTCPSCEKTLECELGALEGVQTVKADRFTKTVRVDFAAAALQKPSRQELEDRIHEAGYQVLRSRERRWLPEGKAVLALAVGLLLGAFYLILDHLGVFADIPVISGTLGYGALFVIGLLTSLHCLAMCGALLLSRASTTDTGNQIMPTLLYNSGRLISYTASGALAGFLGAAFSFSFRSRFVIMSIAAVLMLFFALRTLGILNLAFLKRWFPAAVCPSGANTGRKGGSLVLGLLNGLMPCGPLQAMQLFALGTGSALTGALSMLAFGLGTVPLMLGIGAVIALLPKRFLGSVNRASGVLMLVFAIVTAGRAYGFAGSVPDADSGGQQGELTVITPVAERSAAAAIAPGAIRPVMEDGMQVIIMPIGARSYPAFVVQKGIPVRWIIRAESGKLNGCNNAIIIPSYDAQIRLSPGDTIVEFTPTVEGVVPFSCWMGMIRSTFTVTGGPL